MEGRKRYEVLKDGEVIFSGSRQHTADFLGINVTSVSTIANSLTVTRKGYRIRVIDTKRKKPKPKPVKHRKQYVTTALERRNAVECVFPYDVGKMRSKIRLGDKVRVFTEIEYIGGRVVIGEFPIVAMYPHVFDVWTGHYLESFTWFDLYRKDGVELVG